MFSRGEGGGEEIIDLSVGMGRDEHGEDECEDNKMANGVMVRNREGRQREEKGKI